MFPLFPNHAEIKEEYDLVNECSGTRSPFGLGGYGL